MSAHQIVIIGASFGGLPVAHSLLKDVLPKLQSEKTTYKVVLINPSDEFFWKIGAPRVIVNPTALGLDKTLLKFVPTFDKYGDKFEFIQTYAEKIVPETNTVELRNGASVHYDSLVIASGTHFKSELWSTTPGTEKLRAALKDVHDRLPTAESVLIAGGGAAGVETAGEFGEVYGKKKDITLLSGSDGLLSRLARKDIGQDAQSKLEKQGVKVMNGSVRVQNVQEQDGKTVLTLTNGEIKTVDIYIDATGDSPNSEFIPEAWLDEKKRVKTDVSTLRVDVPGVTGVYAIGAVASYSNGGVMDTKFGYKPLCYSIEVDLAGGGKLSLETMKAITDEFSETAPRKKNIYKPFQSDMQIVPVGSTQGVG